MLFYWHVQKRVIMLIEIAPHPGLRKIVETYWLVKDEDLKVRILPEGTINIVFNLGKPVVISDSEKENKVFKNSWLVGAHKKYYVQDEDIESFLVGIKFKQEGAYRFLKFPQHQIANKVVELDSVLNGYSMDTRSKLIDADNVGQIKQILDRFLIKRADISNGTPDIVDFALKKVQMNGSPSLIKNLCSAANISHKHLITLFNDKVGLSPKLLYRINKFNKAISITKDKEEVNWCDIAFSCHYYDQAHFINEFRHFSGISPGKYLKKRMPEGYRVKVD